MFSPPFKGGFLLPVHVPIQECGPSEKQDVPAKTATSLTVGFGGQKKGAKIT